MGDGETTGAAARPRIEVGERNDGGLEVIVRAEAPAAGTGAGGEVWVPSVRIERIPVPEGDPAATGYLYRLVVETKLRGGAAAVRQLPTPVAPQVAAVVPFASGEPGVAADDSLLAVDLRARGGESPAVARWQRTADAVDQVYVFLDPGRTVELGPGQPIGPPGGGGGAGS